MLWAFATAAEECWPPPRAATGELQEEAAEEPQAVLARAVQAALQGDKRHLRCPAGLLQQVQPQGWTRGTEH